jgi:cellulose synthase (UDP-forming)
VREIGGFQPTRAEDHLDTVVLAAHGYRGVFVPDVIAVGAGPDTFATYLRQQFAWAYSMCQIMLHHTPRLIRRYSPIQAVQFLFCQTWYTVWSTSLAIMWLLPSVALITHQPIVSVRVSQFLLYFLPVPITSSIMWCWTRRWFQPRGVRLSWRAVVLEIARWPVVLGAVISAVLRIKRPYMITPKGVPGEPARGGLGVYGLYVVLALLPLLALWCFRLTGGVGGVGGYYALSLANAVMVVVLVATTVVVELRGTTTTGAGIVAAARGRLCIVASAVTLIVLVVLSARAVWPAMIHALG